MEKQISAVVTYKLSIKEFECVKKFLSEIDGLSKKLQKSMCWKSFSIHLIEKGLRVIFVHLWDTEDQWLDGMHYKKESVFVVFIGFDKSGLELYSLGITGADDIDTLCERYENDPDFIFFDTDFSATKEDLIEDFISDLKKRDLE